MSELEKELDKGYKLKEITEYLPAVVPYVFAPMNGEEINMQKIFPLYITAALAMVGVFFIVYKILTYNTSSVKKNSKS